MFLSGDYIQNGVMPLSLKLPQFQCYKILAACIKSEGRPFVITVRDQMYPKTVVFLKLILVFLYFLDEFWAVVPRFNRIKI
jgi:hypothetical protein